MKSRIFSLNPYEPAGLPDQLKIAGSISRLSDTIAISYELSGPLAKLAIPEPADKCLRKNDLWKETCFEFFLSLKNSGPYWEFNLSPSGHWNVYSFKAYRQGLQEEPAITALPFRIVKQTGVLQLSMKLDLHNIIPHGQTMKAGISAVVKSIDGAITYWALSHPGPQPDFHRPDSFIFEL